MTLKQQLFIITSAFVQPEQTAGSGHCCSAESHRRLHTDAQMIQLSH